MFDKATKKEYSLIMPITLGNDISKWQGDVDYNTFKNNAQFVIIKTTEGTNFVDPKFKRNQEEAHKTNILLGYYHFARPDLGNSAQAEADDFLEAIGDLRDGELLALDYECPNQTQAHVDWCRQWLDYVYSKTKVRAFIYLNQSQVKNFNWQNVVEGSYALWIAKYTYNPNDNTFDPSEFKTAAMQQWSNGQQVPGVSGGVDGNVFFGDLATLKKYGKPPAVVVPPPVQQPTVITDDNAVIRLGKIGDVEYGDKKLSEVKELVKSQQINVTALQSKVSEFDRIRELVKNLFS